MNNSLEKAEDFIWRAGRLLLVVGAIAAPGVFACSTNEDEVASGSTNVPTGPDEVYDPTIPHALSAEGNVDTYVATSLGMDGFSANGRIQPHGAPAEYYFEYGTTKDYGQKTETKRLPPKLAAYYREDWDVGKAGWRGGSGPDLRHFPSGGETGGFIRYAEPTGDDYNHEDGIGLLHLVQYFYVGSFDADAPTSALGGSEPDFRDARIRVSVRGNNWRGNGTDLLWWSQVDVNRGHPKPGSGARFSNWAHTGFNLTESLASGQWEKVEYRLYNDTTEWSYAGSNRVLNQQLGRGEVYVYLPLDEVLGNLDTDIFHVLTYVDREHYPTGSIDFDNLEIAYRNHSVVFPSNGGKLTSSPPGSDNPEALTDGWRNGPGKTWTTAPSPQGPQEIVFDFDQPIAIDRVQLHQNPEWPSKEVEVLSYDGQTWTTLVRDTIPAGTKEYIVNAAADGAVEGGPVSANLTYLLARDLKDLAPPARKLKVRILSGYRPERWGLGEIEAFGTGATEKTDDDWYRVTQDITGLKRGEAYHYRLVSVIGGKTELGGDMTFTVPADNTPEVVTRGVSRLQGGTAKVEGRLNTLGQEVNYWFEYGLDRSYGGKTRPKRTGQEITPRTVVGTFEDLTPGATYHYRLVVERPSGMTRGKDYVFVAR
jgi:hypothetical protein